MSVLVLGQEKLLALKEDLYALVKSIKFSNRCNRFQCNLINVVNKESSLNKTLTFMK